MSTLSEADGTLSGYETRINDPATGLLAQVRSLQSGVDGVLSDIQKEMPSEATIAGYEARVANIQKTGGQKAEADAILARVREVNTNLAKINADLTALEGSK